MDRATVRGKHYLKALVLAIKAARHASRRGRGFIENFFSGCLSANFGREQSAKPSGDWRDNIGCRAMTLLFV